MSSKNLRIAVNDLGRFFGIRSADAFLQQVMGGTEVSSPIIPNPVAGHRAELINDISGMTDAAPSVDEILKKVTGWASDADLLKDINQDVCITVADESVTTEPDKQPLNKLKVSTPGGDDETQGFFQPKNKKFYTVADYAVTDPESEPKTKLHVIQVFPAVGNIASSDADVIALFMNSIPTLELSRAVPFVDILLLVKGDPSDQDTTRHLSLGRFLVGSNMSKDSGESDVTRHVFSPNSASGPKRSTITLTEGAEAPSFMVAGSMELFTSPQTMVPSNPDGTMRMAGGIDPDPDAPLDPFRPLMSLLSLSLNAVNTQGMHSYKSGDLSLVLHDRSQLNTVIPLVSPGELNNVRMRITYGWSHPDASAKGRLADADSNRFADLIDSMYVTEEFAVQNSEFSFTDDGGVNINLKLATAGESSIQQVDITLAEVASAYEELTRITSSIKNSLLKVRKRRSKMGKINVPASLQRATNANSASMMKPKEIKKLQTFMNKVKDKDFKAIGEFVKELNVQTTKVNKSKAAAVEMMMTQLKSSPDPFLRRVGQFGKKKVTTWKGPGLAPGAKATRLAELEAQEVAIKKRIEHGERLGVKPRLLNDLRATLGMTRAAKAKIVATVEKRRTLTSEYSYRRNKVLKGSQTKKNLHVSLGKVLSYFVGKSLTRTEQFEEIQMIFYAFNESASYLHDCNIAQFPINIEDLGKQLTDQFNNSGKMSIKQLLQLLNSSFLLDQGAPGYGFSKIWKGGAKGRVKGKDRERTLAPRFAKKKGTARHIAIQDEKQKVLKRAYGLHGDDDDAGATFKLPQVSLRIESVPMLGATKSILKIHVFDQKCTTGETLHRILDGFSSSGMTTKMTRSSPDYSPRGARHADIHAMQLATLAGPPHSAISEVDVGGEAIGDIVAALGLKDEPEAKSLLKDVYIIDVKSPSRLKNIYSSLFPTFVYGGVHSAIISAKLATENNSALATVRMTGGKTPTPGSSGVDPGLPTRITPTSLEIETFGCPYFAIGQQFFLDFNTNTTADNFYSVHGVSHNIEQGKFTTTVRMNTLATFGKWTSTLDELKTLIGAAAYASLQKE